jgi:penicillin amidase
LIQESGNTFFLQARVPTLAFFMTGKIMLFKRRNLFILIILLICAAAFILFGYLSVRHSVPPVAGTFSAPGLQRPVEIGRDEWGVPHIAAQNDQDLFFAAGYSCAQDRLWEMDLLRRAAYGRLAEILGAELVPVDVFTRTIGFGRLGSRLLSALPSESAQNLQAYTAGVNAYITTAKQLPLEFGALHYEPAAWKPEESLAIMRLIGWLLSMGWNTDLFYAEVATKVDSLKLSRILPEALPGQHVLVPPAAAADSNGLPPVAGSALGRGEEKLRTLFNSPGGGLGSNAWVLKGRMTERGQALLANDTHILFTVPSLYYLMHLESPQINAVGAAFPGLPGLVVGRNEQIAWGVTNGMIDDIDFVRLQPDSAADTHYRFGKERLPYLFFDEAISVRGGTEEKIRIAWSHAGPVISGEMPFMEYHGQAPLVLRWTGFDMDDPLTAFQRLMKARDWGDFLAAIESSKTPGENFFYADRAGQIGYKLAAAVPRRSYPDAILPAACSSSADDSLTAADTLSWKNRPPDWLGLVPFSQLPQRFQPASNWIANANNCMVDTGYAYYLSAYWEPDYRWQRLKAAFDTASIWDVNTCQQLQADAYSGQAAFFVPRLLQAIRPLNLPQNQPVNFGRELLAIWDFQQNPSSVASTVYEMTLLEFMRLTFADEMGEELYRRFLQISHVNVRAIDRLIAMNDSLWFDDIRTPEPETMDEQLIAAFYSAIDSLTARYGRNPGMWNWGSVHTLTQPHPFGLHRPFRRYFNIGPSPSAGGNFTLNNSTYNLSRPFATIIGPCVRQVSDMSTSEWHVILPAGQSGHPFSRHYRDQQPLWQNGRMITLNLKGANRRNPGWSWQILQPVSAIPSP